jgi:hypothetical protein
MLGSRSTIAKHLSHRLSVSVFGFFFIGFLFELGGQLTQYISLCAFAFFAARWAFGWTLTVVADAAPLYVPQMPIGALQFNDSPAH